jgi:hypothetical protein
MAVTEMINRSVTRFKRQAKPDKIQKKRKIWFHRNLKAIADKSKAAGIKSGCEANMSVKPPSPRDKAQEELAGGMRESVGQLAQTAVTKSGTINAHTATITAQAKAIAELMATDAIIMAALAAKAPRTVTPPPGFTARGAATTNTTGCTINAAGVACLTRHSKAGDTMFVVSQDCFLSVTRRTATLQRII